MNQLDIIRKRCSIRRYNTRAVEQEKIDYILEAGRLSPSACNNQPWYFITAQSAADRSKILEAYPREWARPVPLFILICGDHSQSWKRPADGKDHLDIDAGIAAAQICLAATEQDLGTCIICHFDVDLPKQYFNLPEAVEPLIIISVGYPDDPELFGTTPKIRKELKDIML